MSDVIIVTQAGTLTVETEPLAQALTLPAQQDVVIVDKETAIVNTVTKIDVATVATTGPQGPAGNSVLAYTADGAISGHRVVHATAAGKVGYASSSRVADASSVIGISLNAALDGDSVTVQFQGELTEPSWTWAVDNPVFCGVDGVLTQTPPSTGFQLMVGVAVRPSTIVIGIKQPIVL